MGPAGIDVKVSLCPALRKFLKLHMPADCLRQADSSESGLLLNHDAHWAFGVRATMRRFGVWGLRDVVPSWKRILSSSPCGSSRRAETLASLSWSC